MEACRTTNFQALGIMLLVLFLTGSCNPLQAQNEVMVTIQIAPPYPPALDYYERNPQKTIITLRSLSQRQLKIQLLWSIIGERIEIRTEPGFRSPQPIILNPGETMRLNPLVIRDLFNIANLTVEGIDRAMLANGLPEGSYRVCGRAYDYHTNEPLSGDEPIGCSNMFRVTNLEPPFLIKPFFDETIKSLTPQNVLFTWSMPAGAPPATQFKLKIVEIFNHERNINDAMFSATTPPFFEQQVSGNVFLFGPAQPTLIPGRKYAFMVTAIDPFGNAVFRNGGRSEVSTFTYGETPVSAFPDVNNMKVMNAAGPLTCDCREDTPGGAVDNSKVTTGSKVNVGKFEMTVLEASEEDGVLKGRGKINFPMLNSKLIPILVEFNDLQTNSANQAIGGTVKAKVKSGVDFIPSAAAPNIQAMPLSSGDAQKLDDYFKANADQLVSNINTSLDNTGFEMPLGLDNTMGGVGTVIAITEAVFTPNQATFEAATVISIPDGSTKLALGAKGVCMDNAGLCGQGTLFLAQDFDITPINIKLKGAAPLINTPADSGTYVVFDQGGFKRLRIQGEYAFPGSMLVKQEDNSQVKATLTASATSWSDWMADVAIEPFYITGSTDFGFSLAGSGVYDHSISTNPAGMPVVSGKMNSTTPDWNGFFLPNLNVDLPAIIKKANNTEPLSVGAKNIIIDNQGVTGKIAAENVLAIGDGDLGGWYYSVDHIDINFLNNSFVSGGMGGKVVLPISGKFNGDPKGQLDYTSTLSKPAGALEFQFVIQPKNDLDVPLWHSKFSLAKTSNILVKSQGGSFQAVAVLNGGMDIVADLSPLSKINFRAMEFEELKLQTEAPYFGIKDFRAGFASPNKSLSGFPVGLTDIKPIVTGSTAGIGFTLKVSLSDIATIPEADFGFNLIGNLAFAGGRPDWKYDKVNLTKIKINGPIGPVSVNGEVNFFDADPEYGNGVRGNLKANLLSGFSAEANVLFGRTSFYYWYVDARLQLPPPGLPIGAPLPLSVFGFGGGAYYHLAQKPLLDPKTLYGTPPPVTNLYTPDAKAAGFKATIIMGVSDGSSYQMAGTFETTLNAVTMAPILMKLQVDAAMLSPLMDTNDAFIKGTGIVQYDFAHDIFEAAVGVDVNLLSLIRGHGFVHLNVNGGEKTWFFKVGEPSDRVTLSVLSLLNFDSYFMMGNTGIGGIPPPPPQVLAQIKSYKGTRLPGFERGSGLAFGASMGFGPADLEFLIFYMRLGAGLGYDISLRQLTEGCDGMSGLPGIDGWYANGQMYMWAEFAFGVQVDVWFFEGRIAVAELEAAALLQAGLPNPIWFDGWLHGRYSVLDGFISGNMNFHVEVGDKCVPKADPFGGIPLISQISPEGADVSIMADPQVAFNFPVNTDFEIATVDAKGREVNRKFLIELQQFDVVREKTGEIVASTLKNRVFKISGGDKLASIFTDVAFEPKENYRVRVKVQAFEVIGSQRVACTNNGKLVEEFKEIVFTTGECHAKFATGDVLATYPITNQRYFLQQEAPKGFVEVSKPIPCLMFDKAYDMLAVFTAFKAKNDYTVVEVPVAFSGYTLTFPIPKLPNEQIVEVKIVKRRKVTAALAAANTGGSQMLDNFSYASKNKYLDSHNFANVRTSAISGISSSAKAVPDIEVYKFYFRTSKFNTLAEKIRHTETSAVAKKTGIGLMEFYEGEYGMEEGFDVFDVHGFKYSAFLGSYKIGPLVVVSESNPRNRWSENYIRNDFYFNWMKGFYGGFSEELSPRYIRPFNIPVGEAIAFAPSSVPIDFNMSTIDPALSYSEINAVRNNFETYIANEVPLKIIVAKNNNP